MALKTPISILQELAVTKKESLPNYTIDSIGNQLQPEFVCTVTALSVTVSASARTKKEAKQKAAAKALQQIHGSDNFLDGKYTSSTPMVTPKLETISYPDYYTEGINYVGQLNEYASNNRTINLVSFKDLAINKDGFQVCCIYDTKETIGQGRTKKQAKQVAACEMMNELQHSKYIPAAINIPKKDELVDRSSLIAMNKYKELSTPGGVEHKKIEFNEPKSLGIEERRYTVQEATDKLKTLNLNYTIEMIQKNPYIVMVHVDGPIHKMGLGDDENKATEDAMNQVLSKLKICT